MTTTLKNFRTFALACCIAVVGGGVLSACSEDGSAEKAGAKIDNVLEDASEVMSNAADEASDAIDRAAEETSEAFDEATN